MRGRPPRCRGILLASIAAALALLACEGPPPVDLSGPVADWPEYGGTDAGQRYSPLTQITPENVSALRVAWTYRTGDVSDGKGEIPSTTAFEATPILVDDTLYVCTPFNRVLALDPETGAERWSFDPEIDLSGRYANQLICRGVTSWLDPDRSEGDVCRRRIFTATNDARLIALDARDGRPCDDFGEAGQVDLTRGVGNILWQGEYQVTSSPVTVRDLVVLGSAVSDNQRTNAPSGAVRAYDARTGALRWAWEAIPPDFSPRFRGTENGQPGYALGTANAWAPLSVDPELDLVIVPTGNSAPDYYGGHRNGLDHYASSVVALRAATGEVVWSYQTVHHDLWDYDVPAQPTLVTVRRAGRPVPAVVQPTKMGHLFVLHRATGEPLFPVEERPVPQDGVPGEKLSPTQPFPVKPPPLVPAALSPDDAWGITPWDRGACRRRIEALRSDGIFTPPSLQGSIMFPGNAGGSNWGGVAVDPVRQVVIANVISLPFEVGLFPAKDYEQKRAANPGVEVSPQWGTPYGMWRRPLFSPLGVPCSPPPWGELAAVDLVTGDIAWKVPLGTVRDIAPVPLPIKLGVPNLGGPLVTASGLVFIGATMDDYLRAFDIGTGEEIWKARLPAGGQATPMTYRLGPEARQYVVIAAGGHGRAGSKLGDSLIAFALP